LEKASFSSATSFFVKCVHDIIVSSIYRTRYTLLFVNGVVACSDELRFFRVCSRGVVLPVVLIRVNRLSDKKHTPGALSATTVDGVAINREPFRGT
jgi:hypothetical protein